MTELERFAAALLTQWRADGGTDGGPITVGALLDRVLPYRVARRMLGIDVSEDYEALVLRLLSEEEHLVETEPLDAAEMAKSTMLSKLPDLDVLQLLRAASVTLTSRAMARLDGVLPMPASKEESRWAPESPVDTPEAAGHELGHRPDQPDNDVIPLHPLPPGEPQPPSSPVAPAEFLTTVSFTPPSEDRCWSCSEELPHDRQAKFCPYCGADQRQPACSACGAPIERRWKHCAECGAALK